MKSFRRWQASVCLFFGAIALHGQAANYPYILKHIAGTLSVGDGGPATAAYLLLPNSAVLDAAGNLYILDNGHKSIRKVTTGGTISTLVSGLPVFAYDMKLGADGSFYIGASGEVLKVTPTGAMTVLAGNGTLGYGGDGGAATGAQLGQIESLALDTAGDIFLADYTNNRVRKITPDGKIQTIAGNGTSAFAGDNGPAAAAQLNPFGIAVDATGNVYVSDTANRRIRKFTAGGNIQTIAGNGTTGTEKDGPATASPLQSPNALALDSSNNLYFSDNGGTNAPIYELSANGAVKHIAGALTGYNLTDDPWLGTVFQSAPHIAFDTTGTTLYVVDRLSNLVRMLGSDGNTHTVAGAIHFAGNGGPATAALLNSPEALLLDPQGDLLVADVDNYFIRKITPDGNINAFAGTGAPGYPSDGTPIGTGPIYRVRGMAQDATGNIYLALNVKVEKISPAGTFLAVAGTGNGGNGSDGGPALQTTFGEVAGVAVDQAGNVYASDYDYNRVREISAAAGTISNYAGTAKGTAGFAGDGGPATSAMFDFIDNIYTNFVPLAMDQQGNLYIPDGYNYRIRKVTAAGTVSTVVGNGTAGHPVDGQPASQTPFSAAGGVAVDSSGNLYASSVTFGEIYIVSGGAIRKIGGGGTQLAADGMDARSASGVGGNALAVNSNGDVYSSNGTDQIWKLVLNSPTGLTISGGNNQSGAAGSALPAALAVVVNGRAGVGVSGVTVNFSVTTGSATLSAASVQTDATGTATVKVTLGSAAGSVVVTASAAGTTVASVTFALTATSGGGNSGCSVGVPSVTSVKSLTDFGAFSTFASGSYLEIKGSNLAIDTRTWAGTDFNGSNAPTALDGTSSSINGIASFVYYISPVQIDVQAPADPATGSVPLTVTNCAGTSTAVTVQKAALAPGMLAPASFNVGGKQYLAALFLDGVTFVGNAGLIAGAPFRPAKPGDLITTYGVGFGNVTPASPPGVVVAQVNSIPNLSISFGSTAASVSYAGLAVGAIGLYQFNLAVPQVADGDYQINVSVGSTQVQQTLYLTVSSQ